MPVFISFCFAALLFSCRRPDNRELIVHYTEPMFDRALSLANGGSLSEGLRVTDSAYRSFPFVSVADKFRHNSFLYDVYCSYYSPLRNYDSALAYADGSLKLLENSGLTGPMAREYALAYSQKGEIFIDRKIYDKAFYCYSRSRFIAEGIHDPRLMAKYNSTLGLVSYWQGKVPDAIDYYKRALAGIRNVDNSPGNYHQMQGYLDDLGIFYTKLGMPDSALAYLKEAEGYIISNKDQYSVDRKFPEIALGVVYGNEAQALQAKGDYPGAESLFRKAIDINSKPGYDNNTAVLTQLRMAWFYIGWKKPEPALALLNEVSKVLPENDDDTRLLWTETRWRYDSAYGSPPEADHSQIAYLKYKDYVGNKNRDVQQVKVDEALDRLEKEYVIKLLQKDNDLEKVYLAASVIFGILLGTIGLMILRNLRRTKRTVKTLRDLNEGIKGYGLELKRLLAELEIKNKQKDRILRIVVHDLRNPVSGINTISNLLANRYPDDGQYRHLMNLIRTACSDSLELIGEILSVTDTQQQTVLEKKSVRIDTLVMESVDLMRFNALEKQQHITVLPLNRPVSVMVDPEKIRRVINNLISNAIKFSAAGKEITVLVTEKETFFQIAVQDRGIGIAEKDRDKVFDMFTVVRKSGTGGEKSFGLGLSICLQIMEAHEGNIWFESEPGVGTTFFIGLKKDSR